MKRNPWPYAIIGYFAFFISGVVTWVTFATRHQDQLTRPDYYEHEIRYQEQIERLRRSAALEEDRVLSFDTSSRSLAVQLPVWTNVSGKLHLYRPSDATLDRELPLISNETGPSIFDLSSLAPGLWKASLIWSAAGQEFYLEIKIVIPKR